MICALPGFLGKSTDWNFPNVQGVDPYSFSLPSQHCGLSEWAAFFNAKASGEVLMGYSLGGRLAIHALIHHPKRWRAAIIISAHPGLPEIERQARSINDARWANRFCHDDWDDLMSDWNAQSVFGKHSFQRIESEYDRRILADTLLFWSLGKQESLQAQLSDLDIPILWVVGGRDHRYLDVAKQLRFSNPNSEIWVAQDATHRVPWETSKLFLNKITSFGAHYANII